jgi:hypothetical protein
MIEKLFKKNGFTCVELRWRFRYPDRKHNLAITELSFRFRGNRPRALSQRMSLPYSERPGDGSSVKSHSIFPPNLSSTRKGLMTIQLPSVVSGNVDLDLISH